MNKYSVIYMRLDGTWEEWVAEEESVMEAILRVQACPECKYVMSVYQLVWTEGVTS